MRPLRPLILVLVLALTARSITAQIPPRATLAKATGAPRVLVGTPTGAADPALAIALGQGLRGQLAQAVGTRYQVVTREAMNTVLARSGYEADQAVDETTLGALAAQFKATLVVAGSVSATPEGRLAVRVTVGRPDGSNVRAVDLTQAEGQSAEALGAALADQLKTRLD